METAIRTSTQGKAGFDAGLRAHMLSVYNLMMAGVALTGVVAAFVASLAGDGEGGLSDLGQVLFAGPLFWAFLIAPIGIAFLVGAKASSMSASALGMVFAVYAASLGVLTGAVFLIYTGDSIAKVFFITAASFGALSLWGYVTGRDLSGWGSFLVMGLFGLIIASIVNIFLASDALAFVKSVFGVAIFAAFTAYDTQKIKETYLGSRGDETTLKLAIVGAFELYTDFVGLFLHLTNLVGDKD